MGIYKKIGKDNKESWYIDYYADGKRIREALRSKTAAKNAQAGGKAGQRK